MTEVYKIISGNYDTSVDPFLSILVHIGEREGTVIIWFDAELGRLRTALFLERDS
jgi:hypothetical protein